MQAGLVLGQRLAAFALQSVQTHGLAVGFLTPGFEANLLANMSQRSRQVAPPFVQIRQSNMGVHGLLVQVFAGQRDPFLKIFTVFGGKTSQEITMVKRQKGLLTPQTCQAVFDAAVAMTRIEADQSFGLANVRPNLGLGMDLDILRADQQELIRSQSLFEVGKRLAQALAGKFIVLLGPEQVGQTLAPVRPIAFHCQVGQQGTRFIGGEPSEWFAITFYLESA